MVLEEINNVLGVPEVYSDQNWPLGAIFSKDLVAILRLLVALARRFAPDVRLPSGCQLTLVIVRKLNGVLQHRRQVEVITEMTDSTGTYYIAPPPYSKCLSPMLPAWTSCSLGWM